MTCFLNCTFILCIFLGDIKQISSIDAAIEAVARGEDSKESGIAESKSHSGMILFLKFHLMYFFL